MSSNQQTSELNGSCLCGAVTYNIDAEVETFYFCHCEQCRKLSGSAFAANILTKPVPVNWLTGDKYVTRFDYPGERSFTRVFCSQCGSALPFINETGTTLLIPAGGLDKMPAIEPEKNIFWGDKANWYEAGVGAPTCEGFP